MKKECSNCDYSVKIYSKSENDDIEINYVCENKNSPLFSNRTMEGVFYGCYYWNNIKLERKLKLDKINDNI